MHSGEMLYDLEQMTGISGLLPDPHLVGAGYSIFRNGSFLGAHYDFNWNDRLRLHRKLTSFLFITPGWKEEWGGHHEIWTGSPDKDKTSKKVYAHAPLFNRFFIDENIKKGPYHAVSRVNCPDDVVGRCAIRFFYYVSSSEYDPNDPPHKSIYTTNEYTHNKLYEEEDYKL